MVFIDGSNVFPIFREENILVPSFLALGTVSVGSRQLVRVYVYSTEDKIQAAKEIHGDACFSGCRVVLGDSVDIGNGKFREKGVDALLVADLIYHAAMKNFQYAAVISNDSDFVVALRRVEDFGCRTGVVSIAKKAPQRLIDACDDYKLFSVEELWLRGAIGKPA